MDTIAFIALHGGMLETARQVFAGVHDDIRLAEGLMDGAAETAAKLAAAGVEVVISRGATARCIQQALPDLSVVDISTSSMDLLTALHKARARAERIAVVAFPPMSDGAREMGAMLGVEVSVYGWDSQEGIAPALMRAREDGAGIVVGGYITALIASRLGVPCQPVESGAQSILAAAREAKRIAHGRRVEKAKSQLMRAVLTSTDNGILAVDRRGVVTVLNPVAGRLLRMTEADAVGRPVGEVWARSGLERLLETGQGQAGQVERVFDQEIMCARTAINVRGETVGAVATFHDVRQIQKMEATVRKRILASGHVAASRFQDIRGESPALRQALAMGADYARTSATVLIHGETGTGKELFAQGIHNASARRGGPFVAVNCAALPGQLLESELFGYVPGAFTGASQKGKPGLFELAHGGTIFLDEIAEMDLPTQGRLLRVLQEKKVMRLGSDQVIPVDVRVVAATNKDLGRLVAAGAFRDDLFYRLNVLRLRLPPLRSRREDIPGLAAHFLEQASGHRAHQQGYKLEDGALAALQAHAWPGNVRELQNVMARVVAVHRDQAITGALIHSLLDAPPAGSGPAEPASAAQTPRHPEQERIREALERCGGRVCEAARELGVSRSTLWRRMRGLKSPPGR
ncbi:sigma 54-interacting transcriptional regulator [Fundidesulfovibrio soli]|uniref:sigma 54-interacting transcriptional regulator n=1 Tax=Fundidesulfovibrio soli TaxID=2922716 RepID=UPI001FAFE24E|nr:sigma 54-interacting transcriptional regulator [Fundidesulfovibrio soli]